MELEAIDAELADVQAGLKLLAGVRARLGEGTVAEHLARLDELERFRQKRRAEVAAAQRRYKARRRAREAAGE